MKLKQIKVLGMGFLLIEVASFVVVGHLLGLALTLLLVAGTTMFGFYVFRESGREMAKKMQKAMQEQAVKGLFQDEVHTAPVAAMLLILPGFVSDLVGLVLLIPAVSQRLEARLKKQRSKKSHPTEVIEGECQDMGDSPVNSHSKENKS